MRKNLLVFLHSLSLVTLVLFGWSVAQAVQKPSIGAFWGYPAGIIYDIDTGHPSSKVFHINDRIIHIADLSPAEWYGLPGIRNGETVHVVVERDGDKQELEVEVAPVGLFANPDRFLPFVAAFGFWLIGSLVLAFCRSRKQAALFFLLSNSAVIALSCGAISAFGPGWVKFGFHLGILLLGACAVFLHMIFPAPITLGLKHRIIFFMGISSSILSLLYASEIFLNHELLPKSMMWITTAAVFACEMAVVVWSLRKAYLKSVSGLERYQVGLIALCSLIGIIPIIAVTFIPQLLLGRPLASFDLAFLALLSIPVGYGYAIYRYRLIGAKKTINRGLAIVLVLVLLAGFYSLWYSLTWRLVSPLITQSPVWGLVTTVILAGSAVKLYDSLTRFVNQVLYGGWYDFRTVVEQTRCSLATINHTQEILGESLSQVIGQSMRMEMVSLLLADGSRFTYEYGHPTRTDTAPEDQWRKLIEQEPFFSTQKDEFIPWNTNLDSAYPIAPFKNETSPSYFVPLKEKSGHMIGILFLGEKRDGEPLNEGDFDILKVVVHQVQMTLENVRLLDEAQKHAEKVSRLHRQVIRGREEERKRLARDLHDLIIQSLAGLNYQIAEIRTHINGAQAENLVKAQTEVRELIGVLRQICNDLRPPTLDVMDFYEAIQTKASEIEDNANFKVRVVTSGNEQQEMGEDVKLCVYRFIQESLINVQKHAQADHVEVWVQVTSERITVMVTDNGKGFTVPDHLGLLASDRHYGLIGLKEMVEAVNGSLSITSSQGQGCILTAQVPI